MLEVIRVVLIVLGALSIVRYFLTFILTHKEIKMLKEVLFELQNSEYIRLQRPSSDHTIVRLANLNIHMWQDGHLGIHSEKECLFVETQVDHLSHAMMITTQIKGIIFVALAKNTIKPYTYSLILNHTKDINE